MVTGAADTPAGADSNASAIRPSGDDGANARGQRRSLPVLVVLVLLAVTGCASADIFARPPSRLLPANSPLLTWTLAEPDAWLRHHMMFGSPDSALSLLEAKTSAAPDRLLRSLQQALVLRAAGDYAGSNELLEWAEREAEERSIRSVSRTAGSFLVNDRVLSWVPVPGESGMIPFYRMMNYAATGEWSGAAVEARRVTAKLNREDRGAVRTCAEDGMLQYVSGLVFEEAGELNDAMVALRNAEAAYAACTTPSSVAAPEGFGRDLYRLARRLGLEEIADSARARYGDTVVPDGAGTGEVLVIIERGFIAHLTEEALDIPILTAELDSLEANEHRSIEAAAAAIAASFALGHGEHAAWGRRGYPTGRYRGRHIDLDDVYILRLAWPALRRDPHSFAGVDLRIAGGTLRLRPAADLSVVAEEDLRARRAGMLGRLVTRGILKYLLTREAEEKAEKEGGKLLGTVTGLLANAAANSLERADTRSWTLLPDQVVIARVSLPPGSHQLTVGAGAGGELLEPVEVRPGQLTVVHRRLWSGERGS